MSKILEDTPPQSTSATPMSQGNVYAFAPMTIKSKSLAISPPKHDMSRKEHPLSCHFSIRLIDSNLEDEMDDGLHIRCEKRKLMSLVHS